MPICVPGVDPLLLSGGDGAELSGHLIEPQLSLEEDPAHWKALFEQQSRQMEALRVCNHDCVVVEVLEGRG